MVVDAGLMHLIPNKVAVPDLRVEDRNLPQMSVGPMVRTCMFIDSDNGACPKSKDSL